MFTEKYNGLKSETSEQAGLLVKLKSIAKHALPASLPTELYLDSVDDSLPKLQVALLGSKVGVLL